MWTAQHRRFAARKGLRYPSDLTDGEWALMEPMIPPARVSKSALSGGSVSPRLRA
jgi:hypothetical protein